jgi:SAM-dependent methyltransferase
MGKIMPLADRRLKNVLRHSFRQKLGIEASDQRILQLERENQVLRQQLEVSISRLTSLAEGVEARANEQFIAYLHEAQLRERETILATRLEIANIVGACADMASLRKGHLGVERDEAGDLDLLKRMLPNAFPIWEGLFSEARKVYEDNPLNSLSIDAHPGAAAFGKFLAPFALGHVLDVGCGPQRLPSYFSGLDIRRLAGIDPLQGEPKEFEFVRGFAEFLPWPDAEFDTIVCATSLDHVLSLDRALEEFRRVLRPGGSIAVWVGFVAGAQPYDPVGNPVALDAFHMFHFDRPWFVDLVERHFTIAEEFAYDSQSTFFRLI